MNYEVYIEENDPVIRCFEISGTVNKSLVGFKGHTYLSSKKLIIDPIISHFF